MIKKLVFVIFVAVILQCAAGSPAKAQTPNPCLGFTTWGFGQGPAPLGWFYYQAYPGTYTYWIAAWKVSCPPSAASSEVCTQCLLAGHPIDLSSGNTFIQQTDVRIPGLSGGLSLVRTWNSVWPATQAASSVGAFGPNWRSTYEERIFVGSDNYIKYARSNGSYWSFGLSGSGWGVAAPANVSATLVQGTSLWTLTFQNGEQRQFNITTGMLTAIIDRNGNTTQVAYDSSNRLVTITDPVARHLTFTYATGTSVLATGVSSDVGLSLSYAYDSQGRLIQVTNPDLTTLNFTYNTQSLITAVTDSAGKVLESHTYDTSGRGLTSSQANGVQAVSVSYQ